MERKANMKHPLRSKKRRAIYYKQFIAKSDKRERGYLQVYRRYLRGQMNRIVEGVEQSADIRFVKRKQLIDNIYDIDNEIALLFEVSIPYMEQLILESGEDALQLLGEQDFVVTRDISEWLDSKVDVFTRNATNTTFEKLKREFEESFELLEDRKKLIRRIERVYGDISRGRAKTIARTEVQGVTQKGTFEGYRQSGIDIKIWVTTPDGRARDSHVSLDGEEKPINVPFSNGLMFPADPTGEAGEVINCRCTI